MLACYRNNINIVNMLLGYKADVKMEDDKGFTALCYALCTAVSKHLKAPFLIIETLLERMNELNVTLSDYIAVNHTFVIHWRFKES